MQQGFFIRIFIASPGDVSDEREEACRVIYDWNAANSLNRRIMIEPVRVETHSQLAQGAHPQDLINGQLLERCDFLLAILWSRLGTPTSKDLSGTVQEIREFSETKGAEHVLIFFSAKPLPHDCDTEQVGLVRDFKDEIKDKGLYCQYKDTADFARLFRQQLDLAMNHYAELPDFVDDTAANQQTELIHPASCTLIVEASLDKNGRVMKSASSAGRTVSTNGRQLAKGHDPRSEARWNHAVDQLLDAGYLNSLGHKNEVLMVTEKGYEFADELWCLLGVRCLSRLADDTESALPTVEVIQNDLWDRPLTSEITCPKLQLLIDRDLAKIRAIVRDDGEGELDSYELTEKGREFIRDNELGRVDIQSIVVTRAAKQTKPR